MVGTALIFDTETTGLFDFSKSADADGQPRLLSLAAALVDESGKELTRMYELVKPDDFEIDEDGEAFKVNGLSNDILNEQGRPVHEVLSLYDTLVEECDFISSFGIGFDQKIIRAERRRAGRDDMYGYRDVFEIMYRARSLACRMGGEYSDPKKLEECYHNICGGELQGAHNAQADMDGTIDIYRQLLIESMVEPRPQVSKK